MEIEYNRPCTEYVDAEYDYDEPVSPCKCPVCGGFLKWKGEQPICNNCGVELVTIPNLDENNDEIETGKICPTGEPKPKDVRTEERRTKRLCKAGQKAWKAFL